LDAINYFFSSIFLIECILKITAMGFKGYWMSIWNQFDFFVVAASVIDIMMSLTMGKSSGGGTSFLRVGP
jgi:hypothetical protein